MKKHIYHISLLISSLLLFACQSKESKAPQEGIIEITTQELLPDDHFNKALIAFAGKQYSESAAEIGLAIQNMDTIVMTSEDVARNQSIHNSITELMELKTHVAAAKVDGIHELNYFFARAGHALAGLHMNVAKTEYFKLDGVKAGGEMDKALRAIENTFKYHNREMNEEEKKLMIKLRKDADRMKIGEKIPTGEMENLFMLLNDNITQLGNDIEVKYASFKNRRKTLIHDKPS